MRGWRRRTRVEKMVRHDSGWCESMCAARGHPGGLFIRGLQTRTSDLPEFVRLEGSPDTTQADSSRSTPASSCFFPSTTVDPAQF